MAEFLEKVPIQALIDTWNEREWVIQRINEIGEEKLLELAREAVKARCRAYMPYSHYPVGVAILCDSGKIYSAANTEVATYSQTGHAEHNAINKAISEGEAVTGRNFLEALVVCHSGESAPCGACRQEIAEHCDNLLIIAVDPEGNPVLSTSLNILLPYAFSPKHLNK